MTDLFDASKGISLGNGKFLSPGSLKDSELAGLLMLYRRSVASAYSSVSPDEISSFFTTSPFHVSPKVDGELWFLIFDNGDAFLTSPHTSNASERRVLSILAKRCGTGARLGIGPSGTSG